MNWQEFEDKMKDGLQGHETPVDTDALWKRLHPEPRRRRLLPFFWWGGCAVLLLSAILFWGREHGFLATSQPIQNQLENAGNSPENLANTTTSSPLQSQDTHSSSNVATQADMAPSPTFSGQAATLQNTPETKTIQPGQKPESTFKNSRKPVIQADIVALTTHQKNKGTVSSLPDIDILENNIQQDPLTPKNAELTTPDANSTAIIPETTSTKVPTINTTIATVREMPLLPLPWLLLAAPLPELSLPFQPGNKTPHAAPPKNIWLGANAGYYRWKLQRDSSTDTLALSRSYERPLESVSASLAIQIPLGKRFYLSTGLGIQQQTIQFRWDTSYQKGFEEPVINRYTNGNISEDSFHYNFYRILYQRNVTHYNKIRSYTLPISLAYRIAAGKMELLPYAGIQIQFSQSAKGRVLSLDGLPTDLAEQAVYQRKLSTSFRCGAGVAFPLGAKTKLLIQPGIQYDLGSRTTAGQAPERFFHYGGEVGIYRRF